jgi:hypothetical protein
MRHARDEPEGQGGRNSPQAVLRIVIARHVLR